MLTVKALTGIASILCFSSMHLWTSGERECQSSDLTSATDRLLYTSSKSSWQHSQRNLPLHLGKNTAQSYFIWRAGERSMTRIFLFAGLALGFFSPYLLMILSLQNCSKQMFLLRVQFCIPVHAKPEPNVGSI